MRRLRLHGELADLVGADELDLEVASPAEAVRALTRQVPATRHVIERSAWQVLEDGAPVGWPELVVHRDAGTVIELVPVLEGGGDSGPLKILAGFLLLGAGLFFAAASVAVFGFEIAGLTFGLAAATALSGIAQMLAPTPNADYMAPEEASDRQTRLFAGATNLQGEGHPIPIVYGRMRVGSVQIGLRITSRRDWDAAELTTYSEATMIDVVSEGVVEGFAAPGLQSIYLDGTAIENPEGGTNFIGALAQLVDGDTGGAPMRGGVEQIRPVGVELVNTDGSVSEADNGAVVRTISDPDVSAARVTMRLPALWQFSSGSYSSTSVAWQIDIKPSGGSWTQASAALGFSGFGNPQSLSSPATQITIATSGTDISGFELLFTSGGLESLRADPGLVRIQVEWRDTGGAGAWLGGEILEFPTFKTTFFGGDAWAIPNNRTKFQGLAADQWDIRLTDVTGDSPPDGRVLFTVTVREYNPDGLFSGRTLQPYEEDFIVGDLPGYGSAPWDIRVKRLTVDASDPTTLQNRIFLDRISEIYDDEFEVADAARVETKINAETAGGRIPTRLYEIDGLKIQVPSNLTTSTRSYSGIWDGTFAASRVWYDNPAWILWDLLRSSRYGLGLAESQIDKWSLYDAAVWCDELVDDGAGGTHPRFTFNHVFSTHDDALNMAQAIASAMQCRLWWGSGKVFVTQDRPEASPRVFTNANVVGGVFRYQGLAQSARHTVAKVSYRDAGRSYDQAIDLVDRPYAIDRYGRRETDILAIGATHWAQARRRGRWELLTDELEAQTITFAVGVEEALVEPGMIAEVWDRHREEAEGGGRIVSVSTIPDHVELDRPIANASTLRVKLDDGSIHESDVTTTEVGSGPFTQFDLDTVLPGGRSILVNAPWIATSSAPRYWRVLSIRPLEQGTWEIEGLAHDPAKQDQVEDFADLGAPIAFHTSPTPATPETPTLTLEFDAGTDLWTVHVDWGYASPEPANLGRWTLIQVGIAALSWEEERLSSEQPVGTTVRTSVVVGDHDDVASQMLYCNAYGFTAAGDAISALASNSIGIPAVRS